MVSGKAAQHNARLAALENCGSQTDGGRGVARLALKHNVLVGKFGDLRLNRSPVGPAGDNHDPLRASQRGEPVERRAQQGGSGTC